MQAARQTSKLHMALYSFTNPIENCFCFVVSDYTIQHYMTATSACPKGGLGSVKHDDASDYRAIRDYYRTDMFSNISAAVDGLAKPRRIPTRKRNFRRLHEKVLACMESEKHIDYVERNFVFPLKALLERRRRVKLCCR